MGHTAEIKTLPSLIDVFTGTFIHRWVVDLLAFQNEKVKVE